MDKELRLIGITAVGYVVGVILFRFVSRFAPGIASIGTAPPPASSGKAKNAVTG